MARQFTGLLLREFAEPPESLKRMLPLSLKGIVPASTAKGYFP
jgi:hypothetical protein